MPYALCPRVPHLSVEIRSLAAVNVVRKIWLFITYYAKLTIKMPSKQASIFVIIEISKAIGRTFY